MVRGYTRDWATINELALEAAKDDPAALAITTKNYAMVFWQTAQYPKAIHYNERAIEMLRELGDLQGVAGTLNNLSLVYRTLGRHTEAAELLEQAITVARELGDRHLESQAMSNVSNIYSALGRYDEALQACTSALELMRELGSRRDEADTRSALGMILHAMGRHSGRWRRWSRRWPPSARSVTSRRKPWCSTTSARSSPPPGVPRRPWHRCGRRWSWRNGSTTGGRPRTRTSTSLAPSRTRCKPPGTRRKPTRGSRH